MRKDYCFKSDGTRKTGEKIIEVLTFLGGLNPDNLIGNSKDTPYYFIDENGQINLAEQIPEDRILISLEKFHNLKIGNSYPKWMFVSNISKVNAETCKQKEFVVGYFPIAKNDNSKYVVLLTENHSENVYQMALYDYAVDIPKIKVTKKMIADLLNTEIDLIEFE